MIRSLAKNGLVERSVTARRRSSGIQPKWTRTQKYPLSQSGLGSNRPNNVVFLPFLVRSLSTPSTSDGKTASSSSDSPQPIPNPKSQPPRKPKIDLKPAPVKVAPSPTARGPTSPTNPTSTTSSQAQPPHPAKHAVNQERRSPSSSLSKTELSKKVDVPHMTKQEIEYAVKMAQTAKEEDIAYALSHGILKPPPEGSGRIKSGLWQIKELMLFYFRGVKMVWTQRNRTQEMQQRVKEKGIPLSRWETRFIKRHHQDMKKLIPFLLIVLVLEEVIPLIALYAPGMLPSTCILPSQRQRIEQKRKERQKTVSDNNRRLFDDIQLLGKDKGFVTLQELSVPQVKVLCGLLNLSARSLTHSSTVRRIERKLLEIAEDDELLKEEGYGETLTEHEVVEALEERGMVTAYMDRKDLHTGLRWWLENVSKTDQGDAVSRRIALLGKVAA